VAATVTGQRQWRRSVEPLANSRRVHRRRARHGSREAFADRRVLRLIRVSHTWNKMTGYSPQSPTSARASVQATHLHSRSRSMCAANRRPHAHGRPRRMRGASAGWAQRPVAVVAGRSTMRSECARTHRWTPCACTLTRCLGRHRRRRTLGKGNSHFAGADSDARAETLDERIEFVSARGKSSGVRDGGITKMIAPVFKGGYFMGYSAFGFEGGGVGGE